MTLILFFHFIFFDLLPCQTQYEKKVAESGTRVSARIRSEKRDQGSLKEFLREFFFKKETHLRKSSRRRTWSFLKTRCQNGVTGQNAKNNKKRNQKNFRRSGQNKKLQGLLNWVSVGMQCRRSFQRVAICLKYSEQKS